MEKGPANNNALNEDNCYHKESMDNHKFKRRKITIICCIIFAFYNIYQTFTYYNRRGELKPKPSKTAQYHVCIYKPWQKAGYPTGNLIQEINLIESLKNNERTGVVGIGGTRMAWILPNFDNKEEIIYKTISYVIQSLIKLFYSNKFCLRIFLGGEGR